MIQFSIFLLVVIPFASFTPLAGEIESTSFGKPLPILTNRPPTEEPTEVDTVDPNSNDSTESQSDVTPMKTESQKFATTEHSERNSSNEPKIVTPTVLERIETLENYVQLLNSEIPTQLQELKDSVVQQTDARLQNLSSDILEVDIENKKFSEQLSKQAADIVDIKAIISDVARYLGFVVDEVYHKPLKFVSSIHLRPQMANHTNAQQSCQAIGGWLAYPRYATEMGKIQNFARVNVLTSQWVRIGISRDQFGVWRNEGNGAEMTSVLSELWAYDERPVINMNCKAFLNGVTENVVVSDHMCWTKRYYICALPLHA